MIHLRNLGFFLLLVITIACSSKTTSPLIEDDNKLGPAVSLEDRLMSTPGIFMQGNQVRVRGGDNSFFADSEPLFEINGQVVSGGYMAIVNVVSVEDIKSIRVLKNPTDLAMYGTRGSNGVVKIRLKNEK